MSKSLYTTIKETTPPTTSTVGVVGQKYLDTINKEYYICTNIDGSTYTWEKLATSNDLDKKLNKTGGNITGLLLVQNNPVYGVELGTDDPSGFGAAGQLYIRKRADLNTETGMWYHAGGKGWEKIAKSTELDNKLNTSGGTISGNLAVQGNLTVTGETTTEKQKTLDVEDNFIYTNANKVELTALLSGIAIYKNGTDIYAIAYDPATDSVKLGLGTRDAQGVFHFNTGEGSPVAVRVDSAELIDNHIIVWDATNHKFIDSGKTLDDLANKAGTTFTGNIVLNSDTAVQSQSTLADLKKYDLIKRNEKGYVEVGNTGDDLYLYGSYSKPSYNGNRLALDSDVTAALNTRTILNNQTLTTNIGTLSNQFATITPIWDGSTYKKQYDFYGNISGLSRQTATIIVPTTMSNMRNITCASGGNWKNWERVNSVTVNFISDTEINIGVWDDNGSDHNIYFHITFIE